MAPTQDAVEEVSGSMSRTERRRQKRKRKPAVTGLLSGAIQPEAEPSSQRGKRKAALEQTEGKGRKRSRRKGSPKSHRKKADASASTGARHASDSEASSPLRVPRNPNPDDFGGRDAPAYHAVNDVYFDLLGKYHEKRRHQRELVTLGTSMPLSSLVEEVQLTSVRESVTKKVLQVAKVILSLSSYLDGKLMTRSSGFLIRWDKESRKGTVLTSAHIICSKYTSQ